MEKPVFLAEKARGQNVRQPQQPTVRAETWKVQPGGAPSLHTGPSSLLAPGPHLCRAGPTCPEGQELG